MNNDPTTVTDTRTRNLNYIAKLDVWGDGKVIEEMPLRVSDEDLDLLDLCSWNYSEANGRLEGKVKGKRVYLKALIKARFDCSGLSNSDPCDLRREAWTKPAETPKWRETAKRVRDAEGKSLGCSEFEGRFYTWKSVTGTKVFDTDGLPVNNSDMIGLCYSTLEEALAANNAMYACWTNGDMQYGREGRGTESMHQTLLQAALKAAPNVLEEHMVYA